MEKTSVFCLPLRYRTNFSNLWMMVIVPRIVAAPQAGAAPVVCGVRHGNSLRAGSVVSFSAVCAAAFSRRKSDFVRSSVAFGRNVRHIDTLFDNQKDKASEKYWDAGLKAALRANPG